MRPRLHPRYVSASEVLLLLLFAATAWASPCDHFALRDADVVLLGEGAGDRAGVAVGASDIDGNGRADVLVGALAWSGKGAAYYVANPQDGERALSSARRLTGAGPGDQAGHAVAGGDWNGDGFGDLAVGAPAAGDPGAEDGAIYLISGPLVLGGALSDALGRVSGVGGGGLLGWSLASGGDLGGSAVDDLVAGAPAEDGRGAVRVFRGPILGLLGLSDTTAVLSGEADGDLAGWAVAVGDVTGDGAADVIAGAPGNDGAVYVVRGPVSSGALADAQVVLRGEGDRLGSAVAAVGDVNGDGIGDLLVGAPGDARGGIEAGAAYLYLGPVGDTPAAILVGERPDDRAGTAVSAAGDVNGDGFADLLVGAPGGEGVAYLVLGPVFGEISLSTADGRWVGGAAGDRAGDALSSADVDGDGLSDAIVGASAFREGTATTGAVFVVKGAACPAVTDKDRDGSDVADDCDDTDPRRSPAFPEDACNGIDDDCDEEIDEGDTCEDPAGDPGYRVFGCERRGAGGTFAWVLAPPLWLLRRRR